MSDLQLPGQGGLELIAMVRASERAVLHSLPAIAMSGRGDPESQQVALARGFDAFLAKPFRAAVLVDRVCEALAQHLVP
ncbi:MAG: response regulator [Planctomycetota bacterium]